MKTIKQVGILFLTLLFFVQCSKSSSNPDGIPLVPDGGGQAGFANTTITPIEPGGNKLPGQPVVIISEIFVPAVGFNFNKNKFVLELNMEHPTQNTISLALVHPNGTEYTFVRNAGSNGRYIASNKLRFGALFTNSLPNTGIDFPAGNYKESDGLAVNSVPLSPIFSTVPSTSIQGIWKLKITDIADMQNGRLISWRLIFN